MKIQIPLDERISALAGELQKPLYLVGGYVRNYLIDKSLSEDIDLAGELSPEALLPRLEGVGLKPLAEYKKTGTLVFGAKGLKCEYTAFRKDVYSVGGGHKPEKTIPTTDILEDALRRDFKCNAVYYDVKNQKIVDPLGGVEDIKNKVLDTVKVPEEVFSHDGLRLMRLARFCGELNFTPTKEVLESARANANNVLDVSAERIYAELVRALVSDTKYSFSDKKGHYTALKMLDKTQVLDKIIPELTLGRGMKQRADYHDYDVLEHSLKTVLYAPQEIRLYALLHDVAKPYCMERDGKYHFHAVEGEKIAEKVLKRLKAPIKIIDNAKRLAKYHMLDMKRDMREAKLRRFIVDNLDILPSLLALKQADFSACKDCLDECSTVKKWKELHAKMLLDGTPFSIKDLQVTPVELQELGFKGVRLGNKLKQLFYLCVENSKLNQKERLISIAKGEKKVNDTK